MVNVAAAAETMREFPALDIACPRHGSIARAWCSFYSQNCPTRKRLHREREAGGVNPVCTNDRGVTYPSHYYPRPYYVDTPPATACARCGAPRRRRS